LRIAENLYRLRRWGRATLDHPAMKGLRHGQPECCCAVFGLQLPEQGPGLDQRRRTGLRYGLLRLMNE
ncbi:MAG: hypothetical protein U5L74_03005, partial [Ideonella sp.]|nr:hypothetical protein [Ideonella sp.]